MPVYDRRYRGYTGERRSPRGLFWTIARYGFTEIFATRLLLIPVVAGIGYEILRFTAAHVHNPLIRILIAPNLALQRLTTREPDESMIEVAIAALQRVLASEFTVSVGRLKKVRERVFDIGLLNDES